MEENSVDKNIFNAYNGGQVIVANDNATVYVGQNINSKVSINNFKKFQNNKKQEYIDNWNSKLFLHNDNDERALTLADAFIMPHYEYHIKDRKMNFSDIDTMNGVIEKFIKHNRSANMLITGVPGIGKTSIVSWMANEYKENDNIIILRFREWEKEKLKIGLLRAIYNTLNCSKRDLENKIVIIDGFDEIKVLNDGEILIRNLINDMHDFKNTKIIITSRNDYIDYHLFEHVFELLPFRIYQIEQFYFRITGNLLNINKNYISNIYNELEDDDIVEIYNELEDNDIVCRASSVDVLTIPVILYMAIMSDIDIIKYITKSITKPELYNRIFTQKGGIFDKFSYNGSEYDYGNQILRDNKNINIYLNCLQEIAFKMFDKNVFSLTQKEIKKPSLEFQEVEITILEFPIKQLFNFAVSNIEFVHKSIYEYFVSEFIIQQIKEKINYKEYKKELAAIFGTTLKNNILTTEILDFMKYKFYEADLIENSYKISETFQIMLENGMTYFSKMKYKNIINCENNIFVNMLYILQLLDLDYYKYNDELIGYLYHNEWDQIDLRKVDLRNKHLERVYLKRANMEGIYLREAVLDRADLSGSNLIEAELLGADLNRINLKGAILIGANLSYANLFRAELQNADLRGGYLISTDLVEADLRGVNLRGANLIEADLRGADIIGANFEGADLLDVILDISQVIYLKDKIDLTDARVYDVESRESFRINCDKKDKYKHHVLGLFD